MGHGICVFVLLFWPTSQTGVGIREIRGIVPRPSRLLGSTLALPEYREGACRTRQVSWGYQETLSRCNRGRPGYLQPTSVLHFFLRVCVCVCAWVRVGVRVCVHLCTVHSCFAYVQKDVLCVHAMYTCYAMCTIMSPCLFFPAMRIHDNCSLLLLSRASLGAPAAA